MKICKFMSQPLRNPFVDLECSNIILIFCRFLAITHAITYSTKLKNSTWYPVLMIALCWIISIAIAIPIVLGANDATNRPDNVCSFYNPYFSVTSSVISFAIPTVVMFILYYKILRILQQRAIARQGRVHQRYQLRELSSDNSAKSSDEPGTSGSASTPKQDGSSSSSEDNNNEKSEKPTAKETVHEGERGHIIQNCNNENYNTHLLHQEKRDAEVAGLANGNNTNHLNKAIGEDKKVSVSISLRTQTSSKKRKFSFMAPRHKKSSAYATKCPVKKQDRADRRERKAITTLLVVLGKYNI